jgi:hypothetical protein
LDEKRHLVQARAALTREFSVVRLSGMGRPLTVVAWIAVGFALALGVIALPALGWALSLLAGGGIGALLLVLRHRAWPDSLGAPIGAGGASLLIAATYGPDYVACRPGDFRETTVELLGHRFATCGSLDPTPWIIVGTALVALGMLGVAVARRALNSGDSVPQ